MFAQLGNIQFEGVKSPQSWSESHAATFGEIPHVGRKPSLQYTGEALAAIELSIRLSQEFCDVSDELTKLHQAKINGEVLPIITGVGVLVGLFVIISIENKIEQTAPDGSLISISVDLSLKEYVSPPGAKDTPVGEAITGIRNPHPPARPNTAPAQSISNDISKGNTTVSGIKNVLTSVRSGAKSLQHGVRQARYMSNTTKLAYNEAQMKLAKANKIRKRASKLPTSLDEAIDYADNLSKIGDLANMSTFEMRVDQLSTASNNVSRDAAPVTSFAATREGGS